MPQPQQITSKKVNGCQQTPLSRIKCGGKVVARATGSHCANINGNKSLVQCVGRKSQQPVRSQAGLYHRKCGLPVGRPYCPTINRMPVVESTKISEASTCPPTFRIPRTPRCRKSLSMIDLSPAGIDRDIGDHR